ncbi:uncharacterized protein L969DRAFT_47615 [Mixia osmundae IAM 14324]|uniref:Rad4 beta-hairpin domain-containing protein n=1 Tax=Mixia osmundae (strain CBS 9802 / IAM 14324 / JCM 22182 / KY 12970) TaxID=764103 RepID=G7E9Q2_MIXOS|nr:uncharacterized protein L969DRAFT_47615 [Mixia osmundae IAM 14324]KEI40002.1 hypothetical protein L969DRAFT_47615 [Mixia osmundae IAM 14324]GAA99371.1 hypothetical protein E5Q_06067 [Mixia osmundae IAM 14324]
MEPLAGSSKDIQPQEAEYDYDDDVLAEWEAFAAQDEQDHQARGAQDRNDDDDDELEWDQVQVPEATPAMGDAKSAAKGKGKAAPNEKEPKTADGQSLNIVLESAPQATIPADRKKGARKLPEVDRALLASTHRAHTLALLAAGAYRNRMLNNTLLQARLLSLVPLQIQQNFTNYSKATHPQPNDRARAFERAMKRLMSWWFNNFTVEPDVPRVHTQHYFAVEELLRQLGKLDVEAIQSWRPPRSSSKKKKSRKTEERAPPPWADKGELIKDSVSLMKRAVILRGSLDVSAQLFTALCRALDIPARLVFSLQPVDWHTAAPKPKTNGILTPRKAKARKVGSVKQHTGPTQITMDVEASSDEEIMERVPIPRASARPRVSSTSAKGSRQTSPESQKSGISRRPISVGVGSDSDGAGYGSGPPPVMVTRRGDGPVTLRSSRPKTNIFRSPSPPPEIMTRYPVFWTEVYSRSDKTWYGIDATRKRWKLNDTKHLVDPPRSVQDVQLSYVIAYEEDLTAKDVTTRYARNFITNTLKRRLPARKKNEADWFAEAMQRYQRRFELARDAAEDQLLRRSAIDEKMPTSVGGFKKHPLYALERHCNSTEIIWPRKSVGIFRGETVFPRSSVIALKSAESWMRIGRVIKDGDQPMKFIKQRAVTIQKRRAQEMANLEGEEELTQGLYAELQTELYVPPPVIDGKVPRNSFGNLDLFVPTMLPAGGFHMPYKGIAKVAKRLGIDYAEAITGFDFKQRRALPVIEGIVIPVEDKVALWDAYVESEEIALEREMARKTKRVLEKWKLLIRGLALRQRLNLEYAKPAKTAHEGAPQLLSTESALPSGDTTPAAPSTETEQNKPMIKIKARKRASHVLDADRESEQDTPERPGRRTRSVRQKVEAVVPKGRQRAAKTRARQSLAEDVSSSSD